MNVSFKDKKESFKEYYVSNLPIFQAAEKSFRNLINLLLSNSPEIVTPKVIGRIKERNECLDKFNLKYRKDLEKSKQDYEI